MEVFRAFPVDAEEFAGFAKTKLSHAAAGAVRRKAGGPFLIEQGRMVATNVEGVLVKRAADMADGRSAGRLSFRSLSNFSTSRRQPHKV